MLGLNGYTMPYQGTVFDGPGNERRHNKITFINPYSWVQWVLNHTGLFSVMPSPKEPTSPITVFGGLDNNGLQPKIAFYLGAPKDFKEPDLEPWKVPPPPPAPPPPGGPLAYTITRGYVPSTRRIMERNFTNSNSYRNLQDIQYVRFARGVH